MASDKNEDDEELDIDLDEFDLDGDDEFDFGDDDFDGKPSNATIAKDIAKEGGRGFLSNLVKDTARKALPSEYEYHYRDALEYTDFIREIVKETAGETNKTLHGFSKELKKMLPFQSKLLNKYIESQDYKFSSSRSPSEAETREAAMQSTLGELFDKQNEINEHVAQAAENQKDKGDQLAAAKVQTNVLSNIDKSTANLAAFQTNIGKAYYRKSLELQFKSYYAQIDMLNLQREHFSAFTSQFDQVVHNTSLPDMAKITEDHIKEKAKLDAKIEISNKSIFSNSDYVKGVKDRIAKLLRDKRGQILGQISEATGALGMMSDTGGGPLMLIQAMAGMLGGTGGSKLSDWLAPKIRERIAGNEKIETGGQMLKLLANSPRTFFATLRDRVDREVEEGDPTSFRGRMMELLQQGLITTKQGAPDTLIHARSNILAHDQPAIFDNKVHRSITEVIPMYLSEILRSSSSLFTAYKMVNHASMNGFEGNDLLKYDYSRRKLDAMGNIKANLASTLFSRSDTEDIKGVASDIISRSSSELRRSGKTKISKSLDTDDNKKALANYIAESRKMGLGNDVNKLIEGFSGDPKLAALAKKHRVEDLLRNVSTATRANSSMRTSFDSQLINVGRDYPLGEIRKFFLDIAELAKDVGHGGLSEEAAKAFAEVMTDYILEKGEAITPELIMRDKYIIDVKASDGTRVSNISKAQHDLIKGPISRLKDNIKAIWNKEDKLLIVKMENAFGDMDNALREKLSDRTEAFQKLADYDAGFVSPGRLRRQNILEGSLDAVNNDGNLTRRDVLDGIKQHRVNAPRIRNEIFENVLRAGGMMGEQFNRVRDEMRDAPLSEKLSIIRRETSEMMKAMPAKLNAISEKYSNEIAAIADIANAIKDDAIRDGGGVIKKNAIKYIEGSMKTLTRYKEEYRAAQDDSISDLQSMLSIMRETMSYPKGVQDLEKKIQGAIDIKDETMKALDFSINKLNDLRSNIESMDTSNATEFVANLRSNIQSGVETIMNNIPGFAVKEG